MKKKVAIALLLTFLLILGEQFVFHFLFRSQYTDTQIINLAARQQTLCQSINLDFYQLLNQTGSVSQTRQHLQTWKEAHSHLLTDESIVTLPVKQSIIAQLQSLTSRIAYAEKTFTDFQQGKPVDIAALTQNQRLFLVQMQAVAAAYSSFANEKRFYGSLLLIFTAVALAGIVGFIFYPQARNQAKAQKELLQKEDFLEKCNQAAKIGYWEVNLENQSVYWSSMTKQIHEVAPNYQPEIATAIHFYEEGPSRKKIQELVERAIHKGESYEDEFKIITAAGKSKWVKTIGNSIFEKGKCQRLYGTFQEIDAEKQRQLELAQSEQAFQCTFENAAIGMALIDLTGKWLNVNKAVCDMLGYSAEELYSITFQDITHPEDLEADLALLTELMDNKRSHYHMDKRYVHKDGTVVYARLAVATARDTDNKIRYFISQIVDITAIKVAKANLIRSLEISTEQNERLKNFSYIISHNLRSHASGIAALVDIARVKEPGLHENPVMNMLKQASDNFSETIDHLSHVVDIQSIDQANLAKVQLKPVIDHQIDSVLVLAQNKQVTIINRVPDGLSVVALDAYLESIVLNLITNAIKYRSDQRESHLIITATEDAQYVRVEFADNGLGIDLQRHGHQLFGMYKTFHRHPEAKGLGLFITKNQLLAMGGKIEVESAVGTGTTFKLYLNK